MPSRRMIVKGAITLPLATSLPQSAHGQVIPRQTALRSGRFDIVNRSLTQICTDLAEGRATSVKLTDAYLSRIAALDRQGPRLQAVLALNPDTRAQAARADAERRAGGAVGVLQGIPILIKDNIETRELPTTAGSIALKDNWTGRDSPAVARLRRAGAIILGKANLSEWAQFRSYRSLAGWSAVGGMTRNPYALDRSPGGSSSGSAVAVAASLAPVALGTETNSSIVGPAAFNGVVGLKPTLGLVSRAHVVPLAPLQDTVGVLARSVEDAALVLSIIAGTDEADPATSEADLRRKDYPRLLKNASFSGTRLAVLRPGGAGEIADSKLALLQQALQRMQAAGARISTIERFDEAPLRAMQLDLFLPDFKAAIHRYLSDAAPAVQCRTLEGLCAFNAREPRETALFGQELFERSLNAKALEDADYKALVSKAQRMAGAEGIDRLCDAHNASALVAITTDAAPPIDLIGTGARTVSVTTMAAIAGYPHLTVPMGQASGLPIGLSFIGRAWSDATLLQLGHAFERLMPAPAAPTYASTVGAFDRFAAALAPWPDQPLAPQKASR